MLLFLLYEREREPAWAFVVVVVVLRNNKILPLPCHKKIPIIYFNIIYIVCVWCVCTILTIFTNK